MRNIVLAVLLFIYVSLAAQDNGWKLTAVDADIAYVGTPVANSGIGILPWKEPFSVWHVILNHVFENGDKHGVSWASRGINPFLLSLEVDDTAVEGKNIAGQQQKIDMKAVTHITSFDALSKVKAKYSTRVLRNMPYAGMTQVEIKALENCAIQVLQRTKVPKEYGVSGTVYTKMKGGQVGQYVVSVSVPSRYGTHKVMGSAGSVYEKKAFDFRLLKETGAISTSRTLQKGETVKFALLGTVCSARDFVDPFGEPIRQAIYANYEGTDRLLEVHQAAWDELWESGVIMEGDEETQRNVRFAPYNFYSLGRAGSRLSIPPMGLLAQGYNGHILWDTELWMCPPTLLLNQGIVCSMMDYRTDRMEGAACRAYTYGYKSVMPPWESDDTGTESTPVWALTGPSEYHITVDVAIAAWHYYCMTKDREWLVETGYPLLKEVAALREIRVRKMSDGGYTIANVVGTNEYIGGVTDNAFTNGMAVCALKYVVSAAEACGEEAPAVWNDIAEDLRSHSFGNGVMKEHEKYKGAMIEQVDVNLLGYPLEVVTDPETLRKDLEYHVGKIGLKHGPAMFYSVSYVQYTRLGDTNKAYEMFRRSYVPNLRPSFGVLAETPTSQNPYFVTGAGGLLQAVINGFVGLKVTENGVVQLLLVLPKY